MISKDKYFKESFSCPYAGHCSGCLWIERDPSSQRRAKLAMLKENFQASGALFPDKMTPNVDSVPAQGMRDYADLTLFRVNGRRHLGLYDRERTTILDLEECPLMSPELASWYSTLRKVLPNIQFTHLRLRVGMNGLKGLWLDLPRRTSTYFQQEVRLFSRLRDFGQLEVGQRHMAINMGEKGLYLGPPNLQPWSATFHPESERTIPIYSHIAGFSQPSSISNRLLVKKIARQTLRFQNLETWNELGAGSGNFTLPLAALGHRVAAFEMNPLAIQGLETSKAKFENGHLISIHRVNFHQPGKALAEHFGKNQGLLVDPPRSGLGRFTRLLETMEASRLPQAIIYVSCFAQSLAKDSAVLQKMGYRIETLEGIDQFPNSPHCEWIATFAR